jgi:hypothetical protein
VNGGTEGEIAACKTFDALLSDFEQATENKTSKTQALKSSVFAKDGEILVILYFAA